MWQPTNGADILQSDAARAGLALACPYSDSDEYQAALIEARRAAGVYGPARQPAQLVWAALGALLVGCIVLAI